MQNKFFCLLTLLFISGACNNSAENNAGHVDSAKKETPGTPNNISLPGQICFQYVKQRDIVNMKLFIKDSIAYGNLTYNFLEKDDNKGTFKGSLHNEIIKADYTYMSEDTTSVREIVFRLHDNILTEGYGEMTEVNNKFIFKDSTKVQFTQDYKAVECP
ncbi:MAG: hypothetical protein ABI861_04025 [Panacibacter sp.]